jgi:hypothetical protein
MRCLSNEPIVRCDVVSAAHDKSITDGHGRAGRWWAVGFWIPIYLHAVRQLSASGTGLFVALQSFGALIGFVLGAYLADAIGRKWTFMLLFHQDVSEFAHRPGLTSRAV